MDSSYSTTRTEHPGAPFSGPSSNGQHELIYRSPWHQLPEANAPMLEWALFYARRGWRVFPIRPPKADGTCTCTKPDCNDAGKHPRIRGWQRNATTDRTQIAEWWTGQPHDNIGIATGTGSGIVVVDFDGARGRETLEANEVPVGPVQRTGRPDGGQHHIFAYVAGMDKNSVDKDIGMDIRGEGGFIVAAPSLHKSGARYAWAGWPDTALVEPPLWILELLTPRKAKRRVIEGGRNSTLFLLCRDLRRKGVSQAEVLRLASIYNIEHFTPSLEEAEVREAVASACSDNYDAGRNPLAYLALDGIPEPDLSLPILREAPPTDGGNAECFAALYGDYFRYVPPWKQWVFWTGSTWLEDEAGFIRTAVHAAIRSRGLAAALEEDQGRREALEGWSRRADSKTGITATLELVQALPPLQAMPPLFDTKPWLLATPSGTIDLLTQKLRKPSRLDYLTRTAGTQFEAGAECPEWRKFIGELYTDPEMPCYVQRLIGYCLTGDTTEHVFPIAVGLGRNGKSTLMAVVRAVFGLYARPARWSTFDAESRKGVGDDLAALRGARLVIVPESDNQGRLAEAIVKQVTGGDPVTCRNLYGRDFSYVPEYKVWLMTNHLPRVRGTDRGIWSRVKPINFPRTFEGNTADKRLTEKLMNELPGILNWALEGLAGYVAAGRNLMEPQSVTGAITTYKYESSPVQRFVKERVVFDSKETIGAATLFRAFQWFCDEEGLVFKQSRQAFGADLANVLATDYPDAEVSEPNRETVDGVRDYYRNGMKLSEASKGDGTVWAKIGRSDAS